MTSGPICVNIKSHVSPVVTKPTALPAPGFLAWGRNYESELNDPQLLAVLTDRQRLFVQSPAVYPHDAIVAVETRKQTYLQPNS
jgi:hypothetical protein